jgi:hypothetical protein
MNKSDTQPREPSFRTSFNLAYLLASSHATCLTPFLHFGFGSAAFGINFLGAIAIMMLYGSEAPCDAMADFMAVWFVAIVAQRICTACLLRRGWRLHSRYDGYPWLAMRLPWINTELRALAIEPFLCLLAGELLRPVSPGIGQFVTAGCVSLAVKCGIERQVRLRRLRQMQDAVLEGEYYAAQFEEGWHDF